MSEQKPQIKITVQRGEDGAPGVVEYDAFVLVGWDVGEDGSLQTFTQTSSIPGAEGEHLLIAARALANAMKRNPAPAVHAIGSVMESAITKSIGHLIDAVEGETADG